LALLVPRRTIYSHQTLNNFNEAIDGYEKGRGLLLVPAPDVIPFETHLQNRKLIPVLKVCALVCHW
jgi:hypothetical protein